MKKKFFIIICIVSLLFFSTGIILAQVEPEEEPADPDPNPKAWKCLIDMKTLGDIQVNRMGKGKNTHLEFQMTKIKEALEKAGIKEKVTIQYIGDSGEVFANLGTYFPDSKGAKLINPASAKVKNSQPRLSKESKFSSIPMTKLVFTYSKNINTLKKTGDKNKLVFKNSIGKIKATLDVNIIIPDNKTKGKKEKN